MQEQLMSFETAKLANEKGFIPENLTISWKEDYYLWMCSLQKWLREVHKIFISIYFEHSDWCWRINFNGYEEWTWEDSYEEALEAGLQESLKLINYERKTD